MSEIKADDCKAFYKREDSFSSSSLYKRGQLMAAFQQNYSKSRAKACLAARQVWGQSALLLCRCRHPLTRSYELINCTKTGFPFVSVRRCCFLFTKKIYFNTQKRFPFKETFSLSKKNVLLRTLLKFVSSPLGTRRRACTAAATP